MKRIGEDKKKFTDKILMKNDKRGVAGMNLAKGFVIGVLVLVVIGMLVLLVMNSFGGLTYDSLSASVSNETGFANSTGYTLATSTAEGFNSPVITQLFNRTSGLEIGVGNVSVSSVGLVTNATTTVWNNLSISYSYGYTQVNAKGLLTGNVTEGLLGLFAQFPTLFTILGVVMLVLLVIVIIIVMNRLGGSREKDYTA